MCNQILGKAFYKEYYRSPRRIDIYNTDRKVRIRQVIIFCPICFKKHISSYRKKGGKIGKNVYLIPEHGCSNKELKAKLKKLIL